MSAVAFSIAFADFISAIWDLNCIGFSFFPASAGFVREEVECEHTASSQNPGECVQRSPF